MAIGLSADHSALRDAVRALVDRHVPAESVRAAVEAEREHLPQCWSQLAALGLFGLHLPAEVGGAGYGLLEAVVVTEELGRALVPGPYLPSVLTGAVLNRAGHREHLPGLASGESVGALALTSAVTGAPVPGTRGEIVLQGILGQVLGGLLADVVVFPVDTQGARRWVVMRSSALGVQAVPSHDLTRRFGRFVLDGVTIDAGNLLDIDEQDVRDLAAVLFAAEASGLADWCATTAADHARTREQFGRPIGQFQAVKHRCARMLATRLQAEACAWDAARAADAASPETGLAAAVAGAVSVDAGFALAKDCINTLGALGFTWEHLAGHYLRRAQTLRILLGDSSSWLGRVGELTHSGVRRRLAIELPEDAEAIRADVRAELAEAPRDDEDATAAFLAEHGFTAPHLPAPWGKAADAVMQVVIDEELTRAGLTPVDMVIGSWVVPTLLLHGTDEQQQRFVPRTLAGDLTWCQLFSETGAGSDLAGLQTKAVHEEGGWRVSGQKVWTSLADQAHYGILLARTEAGSRHHGLSYFLLDMTSPGVDIRPLRAITGRAQFHEVFLDDVLVPDDCLVGAPGDGWRLARTTLASERVAMVGPSTLGDADETLLGLVRADDPVRLAAFGRLLCLAHTRSLLTLRQAIRSVQGLAPGPESSVSKLYSVEHAQGTLEAAVEWLGPTALTQESAPDFPAWRFLSTRSLSIAGGTTDIQLNIIAERLLNLPRDPAPPDRP